MNDTKSILHSTVLPFLLTNAKLSIILLVAYLSLSITTAAVAGEGCGVLSLFDLCYLMGQNVSRKQRQDIVQAHPTGEALKQT